MDSSFGIQCDNKAGFILGCENWDKYESFVLLIWDTRKKKLYDQDGVTSGCSYSCPLTGDFTSSGSTCICGAWSMV